MHCLTDSSLASSEWFNQADDSTTAVLELSECSETESSEFDLLAAPMMAWDEDEDEDDDFLDDDDDDDDDDDLDFGDEDEDFLDDDEEDLDDDEDLLDE